MWLFSIPRVLACLALLALSGRGVAALRCGTDLIGEGDSVVKLLAACGEPTTGDPDLYLDTAQWTYNFGPDRFMVRVRIRDGEVERIEELGRGMVEPAEQAREADAAQRRL